MLTWNHQQTCNVFMYSLRDEEIKQNEFKMVITHPIPQNFSTFCSADIEEKKMLQPILGQGWLFKKLALQAGLVVGCSLHYISTGNKKFQIRKKYTLPWHTSFQIDKNDKKPYSLMYYIILVNYVIWVHHGIYRYKAYVPTLPHLSD